MLSITLSDGDVIGKYEIIGKPLGCGNYGCVYKAMNMQSTGIFALKVLHGKPNERKKGALKREAEIQSNLVHKNIVRCFDFEPDDRKGAFIVLDFVDGHSLSDLLNSKRKFSFEEAYKIAVSCLEALVCAHTHQKGIVHGDVKPGNILIPSNKDEEVRLGDFGVARVLGTAKMRRKGSSNWAAPELLDAWRKKKVWDGDIYSDLFSVGVVTYYLLAGRHPFADLDGFDRTIADLILDNGYHAPELVNSLDGTPIPEEFGKIMNKLVEKEKKSRLQSAKETLDDLLKVSFPPMSGAPSAGALTGEPAEIRVNLEFVSPRPAPDIDLDVNQCLCEIKKGTKVVQKTVAPMAMTPAGWQCTLPSWIRNGPESLSVSLGLKEKDGKTWEVRPFYPHVTTQRVFEMK